MHYNEIKKEMKFNHKQFENSTITNFQKTFNMKRSQSNAGLETIKNITSIINTKNSMSTKDCT